MLVRIEDAHEAKRLIQFGFVEDFVIEVVAINKGNYVCLVLGCLYAINKALASKIVVRAVNA